MPYRGTKSIRPGQKLPRPGVVNKPNDLLNLGFTEQQVQEIIVNKRKWERSHKLANHVSKVSYLTLKYKSIVLFKIHINKAFFKISRKTLNLSKIHLVFTNNNLCINLWILSATFPDMNLQEHQMLSSHNQFTRYYITCKSCYYEVYICILCTSQS